MADTPGRGGSDEGFSDSDQAWFDRLTARSPRPPPTTDVEREADLLRQVLALAREHADRDDRGAVEERWQRARARLQREGLVDHARPEQRPPQRGGVSDRSWRRAGWAAALAASLAGVLVVVPSLRDEAVYGEPPGMRSPDQELLRLQATRPRDEAEALAAALRAAGWKAALYQRGREFIVDTTIDGDTPEAARAALRVRGVRSTAGPVRLVFVPE
jgi:hypothetical protein